MQMGKCNQPNYKKFTLRFVWLGGKVEGKKERDEKVKEVKENILFG